MRFINQLNIILLVKLSGIIIFLASAGCKNANQNQQDSFITFSQELKISQLPWGISPLKLKKIYSDYYYQKNKDSIELGIRVDNHKHLPILEDSTPLLTFRLVCYFHDEKCVIFKIEKMGNRKEIENYYHNFFQLNGITPRNIKKKENKEYQTDSGNQIKEQYQLLETSDHIIQLFWSEAHYPQNIKKSSKLPLQDHYNIEIRIYSKKHNPGLKLDFFTEN